MEQECFDTWLQIAPAAGQNPYVTLGPDANYTGMVPDGNTTVRRALAPTVASYEYALYWFNVAYGTQCTAGAAGAGTCKAPSNAPYQQFDMAQVSTIATWNEPDFASLSPVGQYNVPQIYHLVSDPTTSLDQVAACPSSGADDTNCGPALAAQYWVGAYHHCPGCTIVAGDFSGGIASGLGPNYQFDYSVFLRDIHGGSGVYSPSVWAFHPYGDVFGFEYYQAKASFESGSQQQNDLIAARAANTTKDFLARLTGLGYGSSHVWIDEISTYVAAACTDTTAEQSLCATAKAAGHICTQSGPGSGAYHSMCYAADSNQFVYGTAEQAAAADFLTLHMSQLGAPRTPGQPLITHIYYLRYYDGACGNGDDTAILATSCDAPHTGETVGAPRPAIAYL